MQAAAAGRDAAAGDGPWRVGSQHGEGEGRAGSGGLRGRRRRPDGLLQGTRACWSVTGGGGSNAVVGEPLTVACPEDHRRSASAC